MVVADADAAAATTAAVDDEEEVAEAEECCTDSPSVSLARISQRFDRLTTATGLRRNSMNGGDVDKDVGINVSAVAAVLEYKAGIVKSTVVVVVVAVVLGADASDISVADSTE